MSQKWENINQKFVSLKVALINLDNISHSTMECIPLPMVLFVTEWIDSFFKPKWITFQENHFWNTKINTIDLIKHDINIFINDMWQKKNAANIEWLFKITRGLRFRPTRKRSQPSQGHFYTQFALLREPWWVQNLNTKMYMYISSIKGKGQDING